MKNNIYKKAIFGVLTLAMACMVTSTCQAQYPIVKDYNFRGMGKADYDRYGRPVIIVNPRMIRNQYMAEFVIKHETAHHRLGHLRSSKPIHVQEYEADRWASRHSSPQARQAASRHFRMGNGLFYSRTHGTPWQRSRRIRYK